MKIIQSFWSKPVLRTDTNLIDSKIHGGWPHRLLNYFSWTLSCLQLRKFYDSVELVTDQLGKEILIDRLQLPYTKVHTELNNIDHYHEGLWALGKLYAYRMQNEHFLHVDNDVFIWNEFGPEITNADLVAQNVESISDGYANTFKKICRYFPCIPAYMNVHANDNLISASNAGIIGAKNISFFQSYVEQAFSFVTNNLHAIYASLKIVNIADVNSIYEQVLFYFYAAQKKEKITYLFPDVSDIPEGIGHFHFSRKNKGYVHCLGTYKANRVVYNFLEEKVKSIYPEYYKRIVDLVLHSEL